MTCLLKGQDGIYVTDLSFDASWDLGVSRAIDIRPPGVNRNLMFVDHTPLVDAGEMSG